MKVQKILMIAPFLPGGNANDWVQDLRQAGLIVHCFSFYNHSHNKSRLSRSVAARLNAGPVVHEINAELEKFSKKIEFDLVIVVKGRWLRDRTVSRIKDRSKMGLAFHVSIDSLFYENKSSIFKTAIPFYDGFATDKEFEIADYVKHGACIVETFIQGYSRRIGNIDNVDRILCNDPHTDIIFIGKCQQHYARTIEKIPIEAYNTKVFGPHWNTVSNKNIREIVGGTGLWGEEYANELRKSKIALGLLSKRVPEEATTRSVEIPASGTFMLAERTKKHVGMFEEGREAEFFSNFEEMLDKIRYYIQNPTERQKIARAGWERTRYSDYSMRYRLLEVLNRIGSYHGVWF